MLLFLKEKRGDFMEDTFIFSMIKLTISKKNCVKVNEIIKQLLKYNAINKEDAEMILACVEYY
jgi:transcriptional regulator CtsR